MQDIKDTLNKQFPCREDEINYLCQLLLPVTSGEPVTSNIFLYGPPSVGKTCIIKELLRLAKIRYALINCTECYTPRILYTLILYQLSGNQACNKVCDSILDFTILLKNIIFEDEKIQNKICCIILKCCDYLSADQLQFFLSLPNIMKCPSRLLVIIIATVPPCHLSIDSSVNILFPRYNKAELLEILSTSPMIARSEMFKNFLNVFVPSFYSVCRDLSDLEKLLKIFSQYINHIEGNLDGDRSYLTYKVISPFLKDVLDETYSTSILNLLANKTDTPNTSTKSLCVPNIDIDLPYFSKYLLIAAYLSSILSPKEDKIHLIKCSSKRMKTKKLYQELDQHTSMETILGLRSFAYDRLMATFFTVIEDPCTLIANFSSQISSLVDLRLLSNVFDNSLDKPQYKYNVVADLSFVKDVFK